MINGHRHWLISGGIGSGKSAVRGLLEGAGWFGINSDAFGHQVLEPDGPAFAAVADLWPQVVVAGRIDRAALGTIVFESAEELKALENLTHPHIFGMIREQVQGIDDSIVIEIPLLKTAMSDDWCRIVVDSPDEVRLERLLAKGMRRVEAAARMSSQPSRQAWLAVADVVVPNHGTLWDLEQTVSLLIA